MVGVPGGWQLIILLLVILLLFGKRIPGMMGSLGQGVVEFKKGLNGVEEEEEDKKKDKESVESKETSEVDA